MTAPRAANPNMVTFCLWSALLLAFVGELAWGRTITGAQWVYLGLIGGIVGDIGAIFASHPQSKE